MNTNETIFRNRQNFNQFDTARLKRRGFLGTISAGALAVGLSMMKPLKVVAEKSSEFSSPEDPDKWFSQIKGKHRILFDVKETFASPILPFLWPRVFLMTNNATGTPDNDCSAVMVFRQVAGVSTGHFLRSYEIYKTIFRQFLNNFTFSNLNFNAL